MPRARILCGITVALLSLPAAPAAEPVFRSGTAPVSLIELYTSEGCSSCPPAEDWLARLRSNPGLWREFVPVAFHVNYWDHLGWRDALASPMFTERQYAYAAQWRTGSVYTPCFVRDGEEWRPTSAIARGQANRRDTGELTIHWNAHAREAAAEFASAIPSSTLEITVAELGCGLVSAVPRGENAGRTLRHEFVVLQLRTIPMPQTAAGSFTATVVLPRPPASSTLEVRHAIAAWVTRRGDLRPLQVTGGWTD